VYQLETSVGGGHVPQSTIAASAFKLNVEGHVAKGGFRDERRHAEQFG
jgi:hypothetical protein